MKKRVRIAAFGLMAIAISVSACRFGGGEVARENVNVPIASTPTPTPTPAPTAATPKIPNLQTEILDDKATKSDSPIGAFDFKNYKYPLPRGWQDSDGKEVDLVDGKRPMEMEGDVERIGLSYVTTKFLDVTADGKDEAIVILKIDTGGSAIPQVVYVFNWKNDAPELVWFFRTGDRADGGLKNIKLDAGSMIVELFGKDRYIVGELDTAKITGDEEQLCCPTHWTQSRYKWNGSAFRLEGKRLTFLTADPTAAPVENMVEQAERQNSGKK